MNSVSRRTFYPLLLTVLAVTASCSKQNVEEDAPETGGAIVINEGIGAAVRGELLIQVKPVSTKSTGNIADATAGTGEIAEVLGANGTFRLERLFPECGKFEQRTREEGLDRWYVASFDKSLETSVLVRQLRRCATVECIECPMEIRSCDEDPLAPFSAVTQPLNQTRAMVSRPATFPFNESEDAQQRQWHYNNSGSVFGNSSLVGADANVWQAWTKATGNPDVIVAVIDQGVKYDHEDLAANMWINREEIPGNGIDDDGNGYIDDVYGYNYNDNKGEIVTSEKQSHGTHVAGTIAAVNNNGIGVNGIAGGSGKGDGVKIMSLQCLSSGESGESGAGLAGTVRAMKYAADNGAVICQNSWGYATKLSWNNWTRGTYGALRRAMDYFIKYAGVDENGNQSGPMKGGLIIFAAGNEAVGYDSYPAADKNVVSVAAYSYLGTTAIYSNYGTWIDISAPGGDVSVDSKYGGIYSTLVSADGQSDYGYMQGTSMACPHVSGACALAVSYYYGKDKKMGLTPDKLRSALLSSAAPINSYLAPAYVGKMGVGKLDTWNFLKYMDFLSDMPDCVLAVGETAVIELGEYFPSLQVVSYTVSDETVVDVALDGDKLILSGKSAGNSVVTLSDGCALYKKFEITVR